MSSETPSRSQEQRLARIKAIFAWEFQLEPNPEDPQFVNIQKIIPHLPEIDALILKYAPKHSIADFHKMDLAILRQALYELQYTQTPPLVAIDEAVQVAKEYGSEHSSRFVNGVLGSYFDDRKGQNAAANTESSLAETENRSGSGAAHS